MNPRFLLLCLASFIISHCWAGAQIVLKPNDPFVFLGECLTLYCTQSSIQYGNSSTLYITFKGKTFSDGHYEIVNETTIKFNRCVEDLSEAGTYFCKQNATKAGNQTELLFDGQVVHVEKALVPIPKDSINCLVTDWKLMNCTWSLGETYKQKNEINVGLTFKIIDVAKCPKLLQTSCQWTHKDADLTMPFLMNLTVFHRRRPGKKFVTAFELPRYKTVKPSPVYFGPNYIFTNSSCFKINWKHRYSYKLYFNVTLNSKFDGKQTIRTKSLNLEVCDLLPNETYEVGISAFPKRGPGIWSEPLRRNVLTNRTYPSQPPLLTNSSFQWQHSDNSAVFLYWQSLTRRQYGAEKVWYSIDIENQTTQSNLGRSLIKLPPHKPDNKCWSIQIWAENAFGRSKSSSSIRICNNTSVPPASEKVEVLIINSTHVKVMWLKPALEKAYVSSFKVLACKNCSVDLQWWDVDANKSSVVMQLEDNDKYSFGVAAENTNASSGITWGFCHYHMKRPLKPVDGFSVEPYYDKLQIDWKPYDCSSEKAFIIEYQIKYCIALNDSQCHERAKVKTVPRSQRKFQTSQLSPNGYLVWVEPVTYGGSGPSSIKLMVQISDYSLALGVIIGIVIAAIFVFIFIILGCKFTYNNCSSQMAKCDPRIDFPPVNADTTENSRVNIVNSYMPTSSGEDSSPTSSANTEITQLSATSLCHDRETDSSFQPSNIYIQLNMDSLDSNESTDNSSEHLNPSLQFTSKQNANNNAFCGSNIQKDVQIVYVPFEEFSNYSDQSKSSTSSHDKFLDDSNWKKDTEFYIVSNSSCGSASFNNVLHQFAGNHIAGDAASKESTEAENIEENPDEENYFPTYVQNSLEEPNKQDYCTKREIAEDVPSDTRLSGDKLMASDLEDCSQIVQNSILPKFETSGFYNNGKIENINPTKASLKENLLAHESNKDSPKSQVKNSSFLENCDSLTQEMPSNFSGEKYENGCLFDKNISYVKVDGYQTAEKAFNLNDFCVQNAEGKPTDRRNISEDYGCELHELSSRKEVQV